MESKFTKGKWNKIKTTGNKQNKDAYWKSIISENGYVIAEAKGVHYGINNNECIYNALLISKAPEMFDMLSEMVKVLDHLHVHNLSKEIKRLLKEATEL